MIEESVVRHLPLQDDSIFIQQGLYVLKKSKDQGKKEGQSCHFVGAEIKQIKSLSILDSLLSFF